MLRGWEEGFQFDWGGVGAFTGGVTQPNFPIYERVIIGYEAIGTWFVDGGGGGGCGYVRFIGSIGPSGGCGGRANEGSCEPFGV